MTGLENDHSSNTTVIVGAKNCQYMLKFSVGKLSKNENIWIISNNYKRNNNFAALIIAKSSKFTSPIVMRPTDFWYL